MFLFIFYYFRNFQAVHAGITTTLFAFSTQTLIHCLLCGGDFPSVSKQTPLFNLGRQHGSTECIYGVIILMNGNKLV